MDIRIDNKILPDSYFDDGLEVDPYAIPMVLPDPTREERREIRYLKSIYRGVMFVEAKPGQGKDLFIMTLAYLSKRYFGRPIVMDVRPRKLFGYYHYFNPRIMMREINKMAKLASVEGTDKELPLDKKQEEAFAEAAGEWIAEEKNKVIFQGAVVYFHELARLCPRRNPHNRTNKSIGALVPQWRHLDALFIGSHSLEDEIDRTTFLGHTNIWANPKWGFTKLNTTDVKIERGVYETDFGHFNITLPPFNYQVDGGEPREFLTTERTIFKVSPKGLKEVGGDRIVDCLFRMGLSTAPEIARQVRTNVGDILEALWLLSLQGYVVGNRYFDLYNSKNWVNLQPTLAKEV